jgi:hypothetical protein
MFGPAAQAAIAPQPMSKLNYLRQQAASAGMPGSFGFGRQLGLMGMRAARGGGDGQRMSPMAFYRTMAMSLANPSTTTRSEVISPGPTQVIRPSAQAPQRRAAAPQAGASSSLITSTPSPAEVALATTTLLGG